MKLIFVYGLSKVHIFAELKADCQPLGKFTTFFIAEKLNGNLILFAVFAENH